jgi:HSP20 family protein
MKLARYAPTAPAHTWNRRMAEYNRLFENPETTWAPRADVMERDDAYQISVELPGIDKENVKVSVEDNVLTISGERASEETKDEERCHCRERNYGAFSRSFKLGKGVDTEKIEANFGNGMLDLKITKAVEVLPKEITIN